MNAVNATIHYLIIIFPNIVQQGPVFHLLVFAQYLVFIIPYNYIIMSCVFTSIIMDT